MKKVLASLVAALSLAAGAPRGAAPLITISLDPTSPGAAVAPDFSGLSFEAAALLPTKAGVHYFRPDNLPLIRLFHTLGIRNLRIGGNSSDRDAKQLPSQVDLDNFFEFARAAGVKVIYCLRLRNGDPQADAATAKYIMDRYAPLVDCFSIGQEPSAYPVTKRDTRPNGERMGTAAEKYRYETYRSQWKQFADTIIAEVPNVRFCGPSVHRNAAWALRFMEDFGRGHHVVLITEHLYPGGSGNKVPSPEIGRDRMLSPGFVRVYQALYDGFVPMAVSNGLPYRLEEVNNYFNGGATNVSNTFASALWGLDFMCWWAEHGADGVNFHTGDRVAAGYRLQPSRYTAFFSTPAGYNVRPLGYGIKAFDLGVRGRFVPLTWSGATNLNLTSYATLDDQHLLRVVLINKERGAGAADISIALGTGSGWISGKILFLTAPSGDIAATTGATLGGAEIGHDGTWAGHWAPLTAPAQGRFNFKVPAAAAAIVELNRS